MKPGDLKLGLMYALYEIWMNGRETGYPQILCIRNRREIVGAMNNIYCHKVAEESVIATRYILASDSSLPCLIIRDAKKVILRYK